MNMRKIVTLMLMLMALVAYSKETVVWEGNEAISWNTEVAPGTQFVTPDGIFSGLVEGDIIKVTTTTAYDSPQYVLTYRAGKDWIWTDLGVTVSDDGTITYEVETDAIATEIAERGLIFRGQAYSITRISVVSTTPAIVEESTQIWTGDEPISWNANAYAGTQYEPEMTIFAGLMRGDIIKVSFTKGLENPQYVLTYKAGDHWDWTDFDLTVEDDYFTCQVGTADLANWIVERGVVFRGQGYNVTKIEIVKNFIVLEETIAETIPAAEASKIKLNRPFAAGWTTVCLPFATTPTALGATKVFAFSEQSGDVLKFSKTEALTAGQPYLAYFENEVAAPVVFENVDVTATTAGSNDIFVGTYSTIDMNGKYGVTAEGKIAKGSSTATLKGYRGYFNISTDARYVISFGDEGETTGIATMNKNQLDDFSCFDLLGRRLAHPSKGLYIKNGKKYVVK